MKGRWDLNFKKVIELIVKNISKENLTLIENIEKGIEVNLIIF